MYVYQCNQVPTSVSEVGEGVTLAMARRKLGGISPQRLFKLTLGGEIRAISEAGSSLRFVEADVDRVAARLRTRAAS